MTDEADIPSIQCKMSPRGPKSMRKVGGLSLTFIYFYVPALAPRLNSTEISLQLSENMRPATAHLQPRDGLHSKTASNISPIVECLFVA
jgi:hypothetical protein